MMRVEPEDGLSSGTASGLRNSFSTRPEVSAALRPPATICRSAASPGLQTQAQGGLLLRDVAENVEQHFGRALVGVDTVQHLLP